jgi:peptidoglycan hydrolase-like protein with peptidoglycan-binding domain
MPTAKATIKIGSRGEVVKEWQRIIGVEPDGIFGSGTQAKTKTWQAARKLTADGIVGPATWAVAPAVATTGPALAVKAAIASTASIIPNVGAMPTWAKWYLGLMALTGVGYGIQYTVKKRPR